MFVQKHFCLPWALVARHSCLETSHIVKHAGIVADIEKAFNHLPREVVFQTALNFGIPMSTLTAWASTMGGLERRFQIRNHLGPPVPSSTGFPAGCAMSCLAMLVSSMVWSSVPTLPTSELRGWPSTSYKRTTANSRHVGWIAYVQRLGWLDRGL